MIIIFQFIFRVYVQIDAVLGKLDTFENRQNKTQAQVGRGALKINKQEMINLLYLANFNLKLTFRSFRSSCIVIKYCARPLFKLIQKYKSLP